MMKKVSCLKQSCIEKVSNVLLELLRYSENEDTINEFICVLKSIGCFEIVAANIFDIQAQVMLKENIFP